MKTTVHWALTCFALLLTTPTMAAELLSSSDFIIAIDIDPGSPDSSYPPGEGPANALDGNSGSKYLNRGELNTGFIATPFSPTIVQSLQITTANDELNRDPLTYDLFGTNDPITSTDNSFGDQENWMPISSGLTGLATDPGRFSPGTVQSFTNSTSYSSYRVVFPTIRDPGGVNEMQIADFDLFTSNDGTGSSVFNVANPVIAIGLDEKSQAGSPFLQGPELLIDDIGGSQSRYVPGESSANVVDGTVAKYANGGGSNSGFIVSPSFGSTQVQSFQLQTANDNPWRDPASWELYGTTDSITSSDNSLGTDETWTLVDSGAVTMPDPRDTWGPVVTVSNSNIYSSYKMLFPTLKAPDPFMQIAEASFFESTDGTGLDILTAGDFTLAVDADQLLGTQTTHVNFGGENSGFIVTPASGSTIVNEFQITTGGDEDSRDPASWALYGTNDPITSEPFGFGDQENWTLIDSGTFVLGTMPGVPAEIPFDRNATGQLVSVTNSTEYSSYRMIFPTNRDPLDPQGGMIQMAEVQFFGAIAENADFDGDGDIDGADFLTWQRGFGLSGQTNNENGDANLDGDVNAADLAIWETQYGSAPPLVAAASAVPEPSTVLLAMLGLAGASAGTKRRVTRGRVPRR